MHPDRAAENRDPERDNGRPEQLVILRERNGHEHNPAGDSPERQVTLAAMLALVVGTVCVLGWLGRLGFLADLLSRPVLVG